MADAAYGISLNLLQWLLKKFVTDFPNQILQVSFCPIMTDYMGIWITQLDPDLKGPKRITKLYSLQLFFTDHEERKIWAFSETDYPQQLHSFPVVAHLTELQTTDNPLQALNKWRSKLRPSMNDNNE